MRTVEEHLALIDETVDYYTRNPRSVAESIRTGRCRYLTDDGKMCAVGRCMVNPKDYIERNKSFSAIATDLHMEERSFNEILKEEYKGYKLKIWADLQELHDNDCNWEEDLEVEGTKGLSEHGKVVVDIIKNKYRDEKE